MTNDVEALSPGQGCYAALLDHKGKLRADMRVLRLAADRLLVDAEPAARPVLHAQLRDLQPGPRRRRPWTSPTSARCCR